MCLRSEKTLGVEELEGSKNALQELKNIRNKYKTIKIKKNNGWNRIFSGDR